MRFSYIVVCFGAVVVPATIASISLGPGFNAFKYVYGILGPDHEDIARYLGTLDSDKLRAIDQYDKQLRLVQTTAGDSVTMEHFFATTVPDYSVGPDFPFNDEAGRIVYNHVIMPSVDGCHSVGFTGCKYYMGSVPRSTMAQALLIKYALAYGGVNPSELNEILVQTFNPLYPVYQVSESAPYQLSVASLEFVHSLIKSLGPDAVVRTIDLPLAEYFKDLPHLPSDEATLLAGLDAMRSVREIGAAYSMMDHAEDPLLIVHRLNILEARSIARRHFQAYILGATHNRGFEAALPSVLEDPFQAALYFCFIVAAAPDHKEANRLVNIANVGPKLPLTESALSAIRGISIGDVSLILEGRPVGVNPLLYLISQTCPTA